MQKVPVILKLWVFILLGCSAAQSDGQIKADMFAAIKEFASKWKEPQLKGQTERDRMKQEGELTKKLSDYQRPELLKQVLTQVIDEKQFDPESHRDFADYLFHLLTQHEFKDPMPFYQKYLKSEYPVIRGNSLTKLAELQDKKAFREGIALAIGEKVWNQIYVPPDPGMMEGDKDINYYEKLANKYLGIQTVCAYLQWKTVHLIPSRHWGGLLGDHPLTDGTIENLSKDISIWWGKNKEFWK